MSNLRSLPIVKMADSSFTNVSLQLVQCIRFGNDRLTNGRCDVAAFFRFFDQKKYLFHKSKMTTNNGLSTRYSTFACPSTRSRLPPQILATSFSE